jgi:uncharacterized protein YndB with AHSA1/START domain
MSDNARDFTLDRTFDAPRPLVWRAWTEPGHFAQWFGPRGYTVPPSSVRMDVRPGGVCEFVMASDEDGQEFTNSGVFVEVVEPERLVFRDSETGMVVTMVLDDLGDGRTRMVLRVVGEDPGLRDAAVVGWQSSFDKLVETLA